MNPVHEMIREPEQDDDIVLSCPEEGCGRKVVFRKPDELIVIDRGDLYAFHRDASDPMSMSTTVPVGAA